MNQLRATLFLLSCISLGPQGHAQGTQLHAGVPIYHLYDGVHKVGIGTANPTLAPLHISAENNLVQFRLERTGTSSGISADIGGHSGNLIFYPGGYFNKNGNVLFSTTGNIGIGTEVPEDKLHIFSPGTNGSRETALLIDGYAQSTLVDGSSQVIRFKGNAERYWGAIGGYTANSKEGIGLFAGTSTSLTATPGLYLNSDQNVGIGTTSPAYQLDVVGSIGNSSGVFYSSASSYIFRHPTGSWTPIGSRGLNIGDFTNTPTYGQITTGSYHLNLIVQGQSRILIDKNNGHVGIGTTTPSDQLHVVGGNIITNQAMVAQGANNTWNGGATFIDYNTSAGYGRVGAYDYSTSTWKNLTIGGGNLGIGTSSPGEKLEVNGNALINGEVYSKKVKVSTNPGGWPDYVFEASYELRPLSEVETYIQTHKHLPEVPSAKEVEAKGLDLGSMDATLLKKVEELTLYVIEKDNEVKGLKQENQELKRRLSKIEAVITRLNSK